MKNIALTSLLLVGLLIVAPGFTAAHAVGSDGGSMMGAGDSETFMHGANFAEMEDVMEKMMSGEALTATETEEMLAVMQSHHGDSYGMMRMMGSRYGVDQSWMMGQGGAFFPWAVTATTLVWLLVGIMAVIYLFKKLLSTN